METLFKSQDFWELVEKGYVEVELTTESLKDHAKKDNKVLFIIQKVVDEPFFPQIVAASNSKEAWDALQKAYQGSAKVLTVKLQTLCRKFETLYMKDGDNMHDYFSSLLEIVNQMRVYGEKLSYQRIVEKNLRSLPMKYDHVVAAIEELKDLTTLAIDELLGSLQSHEEILNRSHEN